MIFYLFLSILFTCLSFRKLVMVELSVKVRADNVVWLIATVAGICSCCVFGILLLLER